MHNEEIGLEVFDAEKHRKQQGTYLTNLNKCGPEQVSQTKEIGKGATKDRTLWRTMIDHFLYENDTQSEREEKC